jgi:DNA-binding NarL/FixJ family response regulator
LLQRNDAAFCNGDAGGMRTERLRVLVADDDEVLRRALVRLLEETFEIVGQCSAPTASCPPFVLVTATTYNVQEWMARGVRAIVDKNDLTLNLVAAVQSAIAGRVFLSRTLRTRSSPT